MTSKNVNVIGLGYIGLPTASLLATKGFNVRGVDICQKVVDTINRGEIHIYEPDLDILVRAAVQSGRLQASLTPKTSDIYILAVPTPFKEGQKPDLSYVEASAKSIAPYLKAGDLIILESTSPVGTTERIADWVRETRPELKIQGPGDESPPNEIYLAHCPERVLPGNILHELVSNDRIIGGMNRRSSEIAREFYRTFVNGEILLTDSRTAEMSKLTENAFRDVNVAFANELSLICDQMQVNVWELIELANRHPRVNILQPGPGVGGHCIAVDPWFIVDSAPEQAHLIRTARRVNDHKPHYIVESVRKKAERFKNPIIACLGLSYKNDIDDFRESPSLEIVSGLAKNAQCQLLVCEPHADDLPPQLAEYPNLKKASLTDAINGADIVLLLVHHKEFLGVDRSLLKEKVVIDTRGIWR
jgi:UDP-N-acetyl-D-mannosaminuronic acid dehydrogenase